MRFSVENIDVIVVDGVIHLLVISFLLYFHNLFVSLINRIFFPELIYEKIKFDINILDFFFLMMLGNHESKSNTSSTSSN